MAAGVSPDPGILRRPRLHHFGVSAWLLPLLTGFAARHDEGVRLLVTAADGLEAALANCLGAWHNGGSVVLAHPEVQLTEQLLATERIQGH